MSQKIRSPWLKNLKRTRSANPLQKDCDVAVDLGSCHLLLPSPGHGPRCRVILLEKERVAQGATGHNGGQALAGFEQSLKNLCRIFGEELVHDGLRAI